MRREEAPLSRALLDSGIKCDQKGDNRNQKGAWVIGLIWVDCYLKFKVRIQLFFIYETQKEQNPIITSKAVPIVV